MYSQHSSLMLPGASAKQSTIFHITLLRVLSPQQLAPADVAAVQAAVDAAAALLVGLRFAPRHMLCGPATTGTRTWPGAMLGRLPPLNLLLWLSFALPYLLSGLLSSMHSALV